jgi:integrase
MRSGQIGSTDWKQKMKPIRPKGLKSYVSKGRTYTYHRATGIRVKSEYGSGAFFAELAALERKQKSRSALPGTLGQLLHSYRKAPVFTELAAATRQGYERMMNLLKPLHDLPLIELTPQFVAKLRDKIAAKRGRCQANYVMAVISVACEHGKEHGMISANPVKGVKRLRRSRSLPIANRPWTQDERRVVLAHVPIQLRAPVALAMFTGLRKSDVLSLTKTAIRNGRLWRKTGKTGQEVSVPLHPDLAALLKTLPKHDAVTVAATTYGKPWTVSGFNSSFIKAIAKLQREGFVEAGLTFHGLRHTCGTLLIEAGFDIDTVRRWLGQKTLAMAIHYSQTADTSERMRGMMERFDPLGSKR